MADEETPRDGQTYMQRVKQGEQHVFWKLGLRTIIVVLDIIAIGAAGWTLSHGLRYDSNPYLGYFSGPTVSPWVLLVTGLSFIFCLVCILVLLLRRPPKPAHPGIAVAFDLILWMAFIVTAIFTTAAIFSLAAFSNDHSSTLSDPSYPSDYSGEYYRAPNGTWVYNITYVSPYANTGSDTYNTYTSSNGSTYFWNSTSGDYQLNTTRPSTSGVHRDCSSANFDSCAEQDAYVNELWRSRKQRYATETLAGAAQWLNVLLHFVLFVWACVDTHRYNRHLKQTKVNAVADRVIQDMQARGLITVHGAAEGQPLMAENSHSGAGSAVAGPSVQR